MIEVLDIKNWIDKRKIKYEQFYLSIIDYAAVRKVDGKRFFVGDLCNLIGDSSKRGLEITSFCDDKIFLYVLYKNANVLVQINSLE